ncbi:MAG TPA: ABC transporter ATP-binding protein [Candidatus Dormibacteraeota bacterium]
MATLEIRDLTKHYRQGGHVVRALDGVSLDIDGGEFVSIVGRSGSGKTTFLDLVGLLMRPTAGSIRIDGQEMGALSDGRLATLRGAKLGFIFQEYNLMPTLSALENVMLPLRYNKARREGGRKRALRLLEEVGLGDRAHHRPAELSGGQQQRVAVARALVNEPSIVLGDEPTGNLDSQLASELLGVMRRLNGERGVTFVIVTHDLEIAGSTDRIIRLSDGRVVSDEPAGEVSAA